MLYVADEYCVQLKMISICDQECGSDIYDCAHALAIGVALATYIGFASSDYAHVIVTAMLLLL